MEYYTAVEDFEAMEYPMLQGKSQTTLLYYLPLSLLKLIQHRQNVP